MNDIAQGLGARDLEIFAEIHQNGPATKNDLMEHLQIKLSTLNRSMKVLESQNLIAECGVSDSTGGRRPLTYDVTQNSVYTIGVDISRTYVQVLLLSLKLQPIEKDRFDMAPGLTPRMCVDKIAEMITRILQNQQLEKEKILGVGIGTVGPMNRRDGILLQPQGFLGDAWHDNIPLKEMVQQATGIRCEIDNGANTAALAEYFFGTGRGHRCVANIHCGVGIRSAVIRDGVILRTMNDSEDAFAHMTLDLAGAPCRCGGRGCLETLVALEAVRRRYGKEDIRYSALFERAAQGDCDAIKAFESSAEMLGVGIANLARLLNPDLVILSGPLITGYAPYYARCLDAFRARNMQGMHVAFSREGTFGENNVSTGAGLMTIRQYFHTNLDYKTY